MKRMLNFKWIVILGSVLGKLLVIFMLGSILMTQVEFTIIISKKKTGIIQSVTNIADNLYAGYNALKGSVQ